MRRFDVEFQITTVQVEGAQLFQIAGKLLFGVLVVTREEGEPATGGEFELPSVKLPPLVVGDRSDNEQKAVVAEPGIFLGEESEKVDGILSLSFFKNHPFTIDYANQTLIFENSESLSKRRKAGTKVECRVSDENLVASVPLALTEPPPERPKPGGLAGLLPSFSGPPEAPKAWVQVDTGCDSLMLDSKLMFSLHIDATGGNITEKETTDQNGQKFRSFSSKMGKVELGENPPVSREKVPVVFRRLQAEGALGQNFLQRFQVTFDLPSNELIFSKAP